jgi:hypothetical protein
VAAPDLEAEAVPLPAHAAQAVAANAVAETQDERADSLGMLEAAADELEHARTHAVGQCCLGRNSWAHTVGNGLQRLSLQEQEASSAQAAVAEADAELARLRGLRSTDTEGTPPECG